MFTCLSTFHFAPLIINSWDLIIATNIQDSGNLYLLTFIGISHHEENGTQTWCLNVPKRLSFSDEPKTFASFYMLVE